MGVYEIPWGIVLGVPIMAFLMALAMMFAFVIFSWVEDKFK